MMTQRDRSLFYFLYFTEFLSHQFKMGRGYHQKMQKKFESVLWQRLSSSDKSTAPLSVDRVRDISPHDFSNEYLRKLKPVVLEGFCRSWPAAQKWNFKYLMDHYGDIQIPFPKDPDGRRGEPVALRALLESVLNNSEPRHIDFRPFLASAPELKSALDHPALRKLAGLQARLPFLSNAYIGQRNYRSTFHNDIAHNFLLNFCGEKTMMLLSLSETPLLYPNAGFPPAGTYSFRTKFSENVMFDSQFEEFPLARFAQRMEVKLSPGDVLFLPVFTWHQARYETPTIGIGNWWPSFKDAFLANPLFALLSLPHYAEACQRLRRMNSRFRESAESKNQIGMVK